MINDFADLDTVKDSELPWYYHVHNFKSIWDITEGERSIVDVVDSCVDCDHKLLKNKVYCEEKYLQTCKTSLNNIIEKSEELKKNMHHIEKQLENLDPTLRFMHSRKYAQLRDLEEKLISLDGANFTTYAHGTGMLGLICALKFKLEQHPPISPLTHYNKNEKIAGFGIAPQAVVKVTEKITPINIERALTKAKLEIASKKNAYNDRQRFEPVIFSLSGGTTDSARTWAELLQEACQKENMLIVAAVGNRGAEI